MALFLDKLPYFHPQPVSKKTRREALTKPEIGGKGRGDVGGRNKYEKEKREVADRALKVREDGEETGIQQQPLLLTTTTPTLNSECPSGLESAFLKHWVPFTLRSLHSLLAKSRKFLF